MNCTPKKLYELYNDYPLAPGKIEIKEKILSSYQLKIAHLYNIPIDNVKRLMPNVFDKKKHIYMHSNMITCKLSEARIES